MEIKYVIDKNTYVTHIPKISENKEEYIFEIPNSVLKMLNIRKKLDYVFVRLQK